MPARHLNSCQRASPSAPADSLAQVRAGASNTSERRVVFAPMMNSNPFLFPSIVMGSSMLVSLAWHVVVIVLVYKIWQKVKHLPG
jgi:hypothetical protein